MDIDHDACDQMLLEIIALPPICLRYIYIPQKLPERVLKKLGLEQSKSRHIPLHLHERQLTVPRPDQENIVVSCPLPKYFIQTLKRLQLIFPDDQDHK